MRIVLGTRGSAAALAQTQLVAGALGGDVEIRIVRTHEAEAPERPLRELGDGMFVSRLEDALRRGEIDVAVHALKDLPTGERPGLVVPAVPRRDDPRDVVFTRERHGLGALTHGATVGTGSPRRAAFLRALRPDLEVRDIRGNVDTRMQKVLSGGYDAAVLALAPLRRMGIGVDDVEILSFDEMLPAPGQGAIAAQCRIDDASARELLAAIDDRAAHLATDAERAVLHALGASCLVPLGTYAHMEDGEVVLVAALAEGGVVRVRERGRDPEEVGRRAAAGLRQVTPVG